MDPQEDVVLWQALYLLKVFGLAVLIFLIPGALSSHYSGTGLIALGSLYISYLLIEKLEKIRQQFTAKQQQQDIQG